MMPQFKLLHKKMISLSVIMILLLTACNSAGNAEEIRAVDEGGYVDEAVLNNDEKTVDNSLPDSNTPSAVETTAPIVEESVIPATEPGNEDIYYAISFKSTNRINLPWKDEFIFNVVKITDMPEVWEELQDKINMSIEAAMTSWIKGRVMDADEVKLSFFCHTLQYLSFVNSFVYESQGMEPVNDYITIDLLTGRRVLLSDLVEVGHGFVDYLRNSNPDLAEYSQAELLEELNQCSLTQEQVIAAGEFPIEESTEALVQRNSFYLREGMLVITLPAAGESLVTLAVDDIEPFLRVEKW